MLDLTALQERVVAIDEEFSGGNRGYAYHIIPPLDSSKCVLYMTKFSIYWRVSDEARYVPDFGIIGRYGLPRCDEIWWIHGFVGGRKFFFLGDCDPLDLLIFSVLRERFNLTYYGISEKLCKLMEFQLKPILTIPLSASEQELMKILREREVDIHQLVGTELATMLEDGRKLEIEAICNFSPVPKINLLDSLVTFESSVDSQS